MKSLAPTLDRKTLLSTLWIFVIFNYLYCDVVGLMDANLLSQFLTGDVGGMKITETFLLIAGILMEVSIALVLLSRILPQRSNRWANLFGGALSTAAMVATLFTGFTSYYLFFAVIEISTTVYIFWLAWTWKKPA
ncbi:MAG: hypothetical protein JKX69_10840 [Rhodobacteraceae bacterium]|nr:hypothetical protein [Paracoccaceae bacterium]